MKTEAVAFDKDTTQGDNVVHISMSGEPKLMKRQLQQIIDEIDSTYGKPVQGVVWQFELVAHVITPTWGGKEF